MDTQPLPNLTATAPLLYDAPLRCSVCGQRTRAFVANWPLLCSRACVERFRERRRKLAALAAGEGE